MTMLSAGFFDLQFIFGSFEPYFNRFKGHLWRCHQVFHKVSIGGCFEDLRLQHIQIIESDDDEDLLRAVDYLECFKS